MLRKLLTAMAGSQFHAHNITKPLVVGEAVTLVREPGNPHDPNAIRVTLPPDRTIGYIPKSVAATLANDIDSGLSFGAFITRNHCGAITLRVSVTDASPGALAEFADRARACRALQHRLESVMRRIAESAPVHLESPAAHPAAHQFRELQFILARHFLGNPEFFSEGLHFLGYAALNGHVEALRLVQELYQADQSAEHLYGFAQAGHTDAQHQVALEYFGRKKPDVPRAVKYWRRAAEQGHLKSQQRLAFLYEIGDGLPKDPEKAAYWREKAETNMERTRQ